MECVYCGVILIKKPYESMRYFQSKLYCSKRCFGASRAGVSQSELTKKRRSDSLKKYYAKDEKRRFNRVAILHAKHTNIIRGSGWRYIRLKRIEAQPYCDICGVTRELHRAKYFQDLQIHHRNHKGRNTGSNNKFNDDNSDYNLQVLCKSCHASISSNYRWKKTV